jgi:uncharacterized protein YjbI with pentapeptide repeats
MRDITREELNAILERHKHWLNKDIEGWENMRADLSDANLCDAVLSGANLEGARLLGAKLHRVYLTNVNLKGADLRYADLSNAHLLHVDLSGANLVGADLSTAGLIDVALCDADLKGVYLIYASLSVANLKCADLSGAYLNHASLEGASLEGVNLDGADLFHANLYNANMNDTNLNRANLFQANLRGAINVPYIPMACPETGSFIGWKKCMYGVIVKLLIPEDAKRSSATGRKCRCDKAVVLDIEGGVDFACSYYDNNFVYRKGETVTVEYFDDDRFLECGTGIHFFINREEAVNYTNF